MTVFPLSQHKGLKIDKEALSRQKTTCHDRKWEESNKSGEKRKVFIATRFFTRMLTPERICRNKEAPVTTNETGKKYNFYHDKGSSAMTLIIATWKSLLIQKKNFRKIRLL